MKSGFDIPRPVKWQSVIEYWTTILEISGLLNEDNLDRFLDVVKYSGANHLDKE